MEPQAPKETAGRYVVVAEVKLGSHTKFEAALDRMGKALRLNRTVWLLESKKTLGTVRIELMPHMDVKDSLFVLEVGTGRRASNNLGLALEAQVRSFWRKPAPGEGDASPTDSVGAIRP